MAWEHPADRAALDTLRAVPGFEAVLRATLGRAQDAVALRYHLAQARPATVHAPRAELVWREVEEILDPIERVPLYVKDGEAVNGFTVGFRRPHVLVTTAAVQTLRTPQLRVVLAHELGHVMSGHLVYKSVIRALEATRWWLLSGGANLVLTAPLLLALYAWDRKSELSADRAALLVVRDLDVSVRLLTRAHGPQVERRAARYRRIAEVSALGADALESIEQAFARHPPVDERVAELRAWHASDRYRAILAGDYPRRDPEALRAAGVEARVDTMAAALTAGLSTARRSGARWQATAASWLAEVGAAASDQAAGILGRARSGGDDDEG